MWQLSPIVTLNDSSAVSVTNPGTMLTFKETMCLFTRSRTSSTSSSGTFKHPSFSLPDSIS